MRKIIIIFVMMPYVCLGNELYDVWKEVKEKQWEKGNIVTLAARVSDLIENILTNLNQPKNNLNELDHKKDALFAYNFLKEMLGQQTIEDANNIDTVWLKQIEEIVDSYDLIESQGLEVPTQVNLLKQAQKILKLEDEIHLWSGPIPLSTEIKGKYHIALCQTPDLDLQLCDLYHELGHIVHKDSANTEKMLNKQMPVESLITMPDFQTDLERIKRYTRIGEKAFDASTPTGKRIKEALSQNATFWILPKDKEAYNEMVYLRGTEQRADLFACDKLLEQNNTNALLQRIATLARSSYYVAPSEGEAHPSSLERALYTAGCLVDKGIDINKALETWHSTGLCIYSLDRPAESLFQEIKAKKLMETKGAQDFLKTYSHWQEQEKLQNYQHHIIRGTTNKGSVFTSEPALLLIKIASRPTIRPLLQTLFQPNFSVPEYINLGTR